MGTSKSYRPPTTPEWSNLKRKITLTSSSQVPSLEVIKPILRDFILLAENPNEPSIKKGPQSHRPIHKAARRLAAFGSEVISDGLSKAFKSNGIDSIEGKTVGEIPFLLVEILCDQGSTLDEVDTRTALLDIFNELLENAKTVDQVKTILEEIFLPSQLEKLLIQFFGQYIFHKFSRTFYEQLLTKLGAQKCQNYLSQIKWLIRDLLKLKTFNRKMVEIDWKGLEGERLVNEIMNDTYRVFIEK